MLKRADRQVIREEAGIAFVAILFLLAILSALSLGFLWKAGIGTSATATRGESMKAHYLAESAANHAMWRLLHELDFPSTTTSYTMHPLGGGRYGYKVRRHTRRTFATIAAVGVAGESVVHQGYVLRVLPDPPIMTVYGDGTKRPKSRLFDLPTWEAALETLFVGGYVDWVKLAGRSSGREIVMGTLDQDNDINLAVWDGNTWANAIQFSEDADKNYRCFDIAREGLSGDALVVGRKGAGEQPFYTLWNGASWSHDPPQAIALSGSGEVRYVAAEPNPASDEILVTLGKPDKLILLRWDGDQFTDMGELSSPQSGADHHPTDTAYEQSGEALLVYGRDNTLYYRTWGGSGLSPEGTLRVIGGEPRVFRASADPTGDTVIVAALDSNKALHVNIWDGGTWSDYRLLETDLYTGEELCVAIAWEGSGSEALILWGRAGSNRLHYIRWEKGSPLSGTPIQNGPDFTDQVALVQAESIPGTDRIIVLACTDAPDLKYTLWNGTGFFHDPPQLLHPGLLDCIAMPFDVARAGWAQ